MRIVYPAGAIPLDPDELEGLKHKHVTTRGEFDHLEQGNIEDGLIWLSRYKGTDIFNEAFVRECHKRLFGDVWTWADTSTHWLWLIKRTEYINSRAIEDMCIYHCRGNIGMSKQLLNCANIVVSLK